MNTEPVRSDLPPNDDALQTWSWVSYVLHLVVAVGAVMPGGQWSPMLLLIALLIDLIKRGDAQGTWLASHFNYRISTVIWSGVLYLVTAPLWFLFIIPGWIAWIVISIWFLYRIVKGMVNLNRGQVMPV